MFKSRLKSLLDSMGLYVRRSENLPRGMDWALDAARALGPEKPDVIFDVGANIGQTAELLARRFPGAEIHSFEPVRSTFEQLQKNVAKLSRVHCHSIALSNQSGSQKIRVVPLSVFNSLRNAASDSQAVEETITLETADAFMAAHKIETVDILKTDTEGNDLEVLLGARNALEQKRIGCIYTEITFSRNNPQNTRFDAVFDLLQGLGYRFLGLYEMEYFQTKPWDSSFCNALFACT